MTSDFALVLADLERVIGILEAQAARIAALEALLAIREPPAEAAPALH